MEALNAELMLFDFRNGPLRVKYDSVKYVMRRMEDTVFELSLQVPLVDTLDPLLDIARPLLCTLGPLFDKLGPFLDILGPNR